MFFQVASAEVHLQLQSLDYGGWPRSNAQIMLHCIIMKLFHLFMWI